MRNYKIAQELIEKYAPDRTNIAFAVQIALCEVTGVSKADISSKKGENRGWVFTGSQAGATKLGAASHANGFSFGKGILVNNGASLGVNPKGGQETFLEVC